MSPLYPVPSDEILSRIRDDIGYSPTTGSFRWLNPCEPAGIESGDRAGYVDAQGYITITLRVPGHRYPVKLRGHRVAWYLMTGKWPRHAIDHIDRNRANNKWSNLRRSTKAIERVNRTLRKDNTSGIRGVWQRPDGRYSAQITVDYEDFYLGSYDTLAQAAQVRYQAERDHFGKLCPSSDRRCR